MKTKVLFSIVTITLAMMNVNGQTLSYGLTFTAVDNAAYVQLDSIKVVNHTQGGETMIYWPDTTLSPGINPGDLMLYVGYATLSTVGIPEVRDDISSFTVYQNFPNPMGDQSKITLFIPQRGSLHLMLTDLQGKVIIRTDRQLDGGYHSFRFYPGSSNVYFLTAQWNGISHSIQMISTGQQDGKACRLDYIGSRSAEPVFKALPQVNDFIVRQSGILDYPQESTIYTFQFATNIPCPGMPTVEYEGQVYNTIQIFSQCWLKENLNIGAMIPGSQSQSNNGIIEKYCYDDDPNNCITYGGLYQWDEMMQYTTQDSQGICPPGWHLPTDEEWKLLQGSVDSKYGIGDIIWEDFGYCGQDAGTNLKTTSGWNENGNGTDLFGFSGLPGGYFGMNLGLYGTWWSSSEYDEYDAWMRGLCFTDPGVWRYHYGMEGGCSVRCIRD